MSPRCWCFLSSPVYMQSGAESFDFEALFNFMETLIVSVIALVLFIYLLVAMVYPERF